MRHMMPRPRRDRDIGVTVSKRNRDVQKTPGTFETETTTLHFTTQHHNLAQLYYLEILLISKPLLFSTGSFQRCR